MVGTVAGHVSRRPVLIKLYSGRLCRPRCTVRPNEKGTKFYLYALFEGYYLFAGGGGGGGFSPSFLSSSPGFLLSSVLAEAGAAVKGVV